jgi:hypothetical protein
LSASVGIMKKYFDTIDARCKHEDCFREKIKTHILCSIIFLNLPFMRKCEKILWSLAGHR